MARTARQPFEFTVEGSGTFPFDMLRYDACWPKTEGKDSYRLVTPEGEAAGVRKIVLLSCSGNAPTEGRWKSFGWRVLGLGDMREPQEW